MDSRHKTALVPLIFLLIMVGVAGFTLRNIPDISNYRPVLAISIAEPDTEYTWDNHIKLTTTSLVKTDELIPTPTLSAIILAMTFVMSFVAKQFHVKSHIEYCGKKMVRAIMLQWRPN